MDISSDIVRARERRSRFVLAFLCLLTLAVFGLTTYLLFTSAPPETVDTVPNSPSQLSALAVETDNTASVTSVPRWLVALVGVFALLQIAVLLPAARKARVRPLTQREMNLINFLCESPMYIGLLGSLTGVCISQFVEGTLAAPLAYLTTITGILLFMFAKFTIWTTLPFPSHDLEY